MIKLNYDEIPNNSLKKGLEILNKRELVWNFLNINEHIDEINWLKNMIESETKIIIKKYNSEKITKKPIFIYSKIEHIELKKIGFHYKTVLFISKQIIDQLLKIINKLSFFLRNNKVSPQISSNFEKFIHHLSDNYYDNYDKELIDFLKNIELDLIKIRFLRNNFKINSIIDDGNYIYNNKESQVEFKYSFNKINDKIIEEYLKQEKIKDKNGNILKKVESITINPLNFIEQILYIFTNWYDLISTKIILCTTEL